jgi:5-methylcytosine-specific restriction endonuclease McrA
MPPKKSNNPFAEVSNLHFGFNQPKKPEIKRKVTPVSEKAKMLENQNHKCALCPGRIEFHTCHVDHKKAIKLGGTDSIRNKQLLCPNCHDKKSKEDRTKIAKMKQKEKASESIRKPFGF